MKVRMKALKTFRGRADEGENGVVRVGREFAVADARRADALRRVGNAAPIEGGKSKPAKGAKGANRKPAKGGKAGNPPEPAGDTAAAAGETEREPSLFPPEDNGEAKA